MKDILLVTTWDTPCGIAEHSAMLRKAVLPYRVSLTPWQDLNPGSLLGARPFSPTSHPIIHLNYQAALLSQWAPDAIREAQSRGFKVLVTYHDTGVPNSDQAKGICAAADAFVVHEPYEDLEGHGRYWRQGVPGWSIPWVYDWRPTQSWCGPRPIVGTVGFPFPWKNYDLLCEASAAAGWATLLIAPGATTQQVSGWRERNPHLTVESDFLDQEKVGSLLAGCDATAFLYSCANTGTSGAIRQGIAARKPLLALSGCRQFRDLEAEPVGGLASGITRQETAIRWVTNGSVEGIAWELSRVTLQRVDPGIVRLAEKDSWAKLGAKYAQLYQELLA